MRITLVWLFVYFIPGNNCRAQVCTYPGQTPESAIYLCGAATISMNVPTRCGQTPIPIPCSDGYPYSNKNPVFFKIFCFSSGTFGFTIIPIDLNANFSWTLFDVTNTNPADIFTNTNLVLGSNWSAELGPTGASADGTEKIVCSGGRQNLFSRMPDLIQGRTYILMVVDETASFEPFQISVDNGTASITDPVEPAMANASLSCDGTVLILKFNKQMRCPTLAPDGSDFQLTGPAHIIGAVPGDCLNLAGSDSVYLSLDQSLPYGTYTLTMVNGSDGNTMSDICRRYIPVQESINFTVLAPEATKMDSIKPVGCSPGYFELVFKKPIQCNSIAADGSDIFITGPQAIPISPDKCPAGESVNILRFNFIPGNILPGNYQLHLGKGSDGNSILDKCGMESPDTLLNFDIKEFVVADFNFIIPPGCGKTRVAFSHDGAHRVNQWNWNFGGGLNSSLQNPDILFTNPGQHQVTLQVSNGICSDTASAMIFTNAPLQTSFDIPSMICSGDTVQITNRSTGSIDEWNWDLGNGIRSNLKEPVSFIYSSLGYDAFYTVRLLAKNNNLNCEGNFSRVIRVLNDCTIRIPSAFSPNADGLNDYFYPLQALKAKQLVFRIYDRYGQLVFISRDWTQKWDGNFKGRPMPVGVYLWMMEYIESGSGIRISRKGTVSLIR